MNTEQIKMNILIYQSWSESGLVRPALSLHLQVQHLSDPCSNPVGVSPGRATGEELKYLLIESESRLAPTVT